ncbi:uncharacterized protein LOC120270898 [Dioscorea cayenensis subsp. rotundata]|uniref:Uncharacterized protein LOC120270898 n=1 Tax=Dioscorea cayennensis subsp. rotundata TaxID=55577 RepID=A0AB40C5U6_DIOCR|nr:uncharacterized protein LOC120270898 [Dioscorea cayenensis subsp. rotundata]
MESRQIPAFGLWNSCELQDLYFQSAYKLEFSEDGDLKANCQLHHSQKFQYGRNRVKDVEKKGKIQNQRRHRIPMAVDEDLYEIPPELLYQKSNRRRCVRSFWLGCLGLNCIP